MLQEEQHEHMSGPLFASNSMHSITNLGTFLIVTAEIKIPNYSAIFQGITNITAKIKVITN